MTNENCPSSQVFILEEDDDLFNLNEKLVQYESRVSHARQLLVSHLPHHPPVTLEFNELNYSVRDSNTRKFFGFGPYVSKNMKSILKDSNGIFKPGELTAIMGPSGAGKSTLMNILAGYKTHNVQGTISVNGKPRDLTAFRKLACYIMQDDVLLPHLTVWEAMRYAAALKLPRLSKSHQELVISEILDIIGLSECKNVKTSNVSGGQRKRLAIALELINNPPVMFFDEPTSGLDSASCYSCVALLKALAQGGRTIIATIHQPSARIFEQFDSLYLLSEGQCCFRGSVRSLVPFLGRNGLNCPAYHNPADFAIEVSNGDYGEKWVSILVKATALQSDSDSSGLANDCSDNLSEVIEDRSYSPAAQKKFNKTHSDSGKEGSKELVNLVQTPFNAESKETVDSHYGSCSCRCGRFCNQFTILLKRSFLCISRDMMLTHLRLASTILVGLLIGFIYQGNGNDASKVFNNAGNLFFGLLFMVFSSMMSTVLTFPLERGVLVREHLNCWYSLKSYFLAKTCADIPFQIFFPLLYVVITYYMTEQPHEAFRFFTVCGMAILLSLVAQSIGLLIGAAFAIQSSVFIGPISTIPIFLFSGFFVTLSTVPAYLRWFSCISYAKLAFQSTLTAVYGFDRENLKCNQPYCHFKNPKKFLEQMDASDISIMEQSLYLIAILFVVRFASYWMLRLKIMAERK